MTPEISVIIPTHNRRAMLREALASVMAQRGASFEVIVVDDGSTDASWQDLSARSYWQDLSYATPPVTSGPTVYAPYASNGADQPLPATVGSRSRAAP